MIKSLPILEEFDLGWTILKVKPIAVLLNYFTIMTILTNYMNWVNLTNNNKIKLISVHVKNAPPLLLLLTLHKRSLASKFKTGWFKQIAGWTTAKWSGVKRNSIKKNFYFVIPLRQPLKSVIWWHFCIL